MYSLVCHQHTKLYIIYIMRLLQIEIIMTTPPRLPPPWRSFSQKKAPHSIFVRHRFFSHFKNYFLIFATFLATLATLPTFSVKDLKPLVKSASSTAPISSGFTAEQQYGHFVANLLIDC